MVLIEERQQDVTAKLQSCISIPAQRSEIVAIIVRLAVTPRTHHQIIHGIASRKATRRHGETAELYFHSSAAVRDCSHHSSPGCDATDPSPDNSWYCFDLSAPRPRKNGSRPTCLPGPTNLAPT